MGVTVAVGEGGTGVKVGVDTTVGVGVGLNEDEIWQAGVIKRMKPTKHTRILKALICFRSFFIALH